LSRYSLDKDNKRAYEKKYLKAVNSILPINIQLFAKSVDKEELLEKISNGIIDRANFERSYKYFKKQIKNGITTPIETVFDKGDRYYHIINHHDYMLGIENVDKIVKVLKTPSCIYETRDKLGIVGKCYLENLSDDPLIVITRNGIITAYKPEAAYLSKIKKGRVLWREN